MYRPWGCRGVPPSDFGRSVNPISTKGGRLCPPYNTGTPGFSDLPTALSSAAAAARHYSEIKVTFPIWCTTKTWFSRMNRGRNNGLIEKFHFLQLWTRTKILAPVDFFDSIKNKSMNILRHRRSWFLVKKTKFPTCYLKSLWRGSVKNYITTGQKTETKTKHNKLQICLNNEISLKNLKKRTLEKWSPNHKLFASHVHWDSAANLC